MPIDAERWRRADEIFQQAIELDADDARMALVDRLTGDDQALRTLVLDLLAADAEQGSVLDAPVGLLAGALLNGQEQPDGDDSPPGEPVADALIGRTIGRYRITRRLGEGGMGLVYEAEQDQPRRRVALKLMRSAWFTGEDGLRFFRREAEALARLQHPGIAAIYEAGRADDGSPFFVMELVPGEPLDAALDAWTSAAASLDGASLRARLGVFLEICDAIAYAHQRGVIHRDLKPSNILVTPGDRAPRVKVVDFGLARISGADVSMIASRTETSALRGTLPYMSPEQTMGVPEEIDFRSDVYSLGVILFRMLTGEHPYAVRPDALLEAVRTIRETPPRKAGAAAPALRGEIETIIAKALEKEPDRRYQSAAALADDIRRFLANLPILARPPSTTYQLRKLAARHRAAAALLAVLALVLAGSTVTLSFLYRAERSSSATARREAAKSERINAFLQDMLSSADPSRAQGRVLTVDMMLDEAASRIDTSFVTEPDVLAAVRRTIGNTYFSLGNAQPAESQLRRAVATLERAPRDHRADLAAVLGDLSGMLVDRGAYAEAESIARSALALVTAGGADDPEVSPHLARLAAIAKHEDRYAQAESLYLGALAIDRRHYGNEHPRILSTLGGLANLREIQGNLVAAESLYHQIEAMEIRILGPGHPDVATTENDLAVILDKQGRYPEAEALYRKSIARGRELYGGSHPLIAGRLSNLGTTLRMQARYREAEEVYRESLAMRRTSGDDDPPSTARTEGALAMVVSAQGRHAEAESLARVSLERRRKHFGPGHDEVIRGEVTLAGILRKARRPAEAEPLYVDALDGFRKLYGPEHRDVCTALQGLAGTVQDRGRLAEAESLYTQVLELRRKVSGRDHPLTAGVLASMGGLAMQRGDTTAAEPRLREALGIWEKKLPPNDTRISDAVIALSTSLPACGRAAEAESILSRRHDTVANLQPPSPDDVRRLRERLVALRTSRRG